MQAANISELNVREAHAARRDSEIAPKNNTLVKSRLYIRWAPAQSFPTFFFRWTARSSSRSATPSRSLPTTALCFSSGSRCPPTPLAPCGNFDIGYLLRAFAWPGASAR